MNYARFRFQFQVPVPGSASRIAVSLYRFLVVALLRTCEIIFLYFFKVWNFNNDGSINEIDIDGTAKTVSFSSDGVQVIIGCEDFCVFFWDWQKRDASLKKVILPAFPTVHIACDPNMIYTCSWNLHVCKINLDSLQISTVRHGLAAPLISPDGKTVIRWVMNEFICRYIFTGIEVKYNAGGYITNYLKLVILINGSLE